jgi:hypothetical protein
MLDWWAFHQDAVILTAVCAVVWAVVHELAKAAIKKALGIPYK